MKNKRVKQNHNLLRYKLAKRGLIFIAFISLSACFHEDSDVEPNQAFSNAFTQISNISSKTEVIISDQTDNSMAFNSLINIFGDSGFSSGDNSTSIETSGVLSKGMVKSESDLVQLSEIIDVNAIQHKFFSTLKQYTTDSEKTIVKQKISNRLLHDNNSTDDEFFSPQEIEEILVEFFNPPVQDGNVYTYTGKNSLCEGDVDCLKKINNLTLELVIDTSDSGAINFKINGIVFTTFEYSPNRLALEVILEGAKDLAELVDDESIISLFPQTFRGSFKVSIEIFSDTKVEIVTSIPQAIEVDGVIDGEVVKMTLESTSKLMALVADSSTNTASLEFGIGMLYAKFLGGDENTNEFEISLQALTALFKLDIDADTLVATDIGIGEETFTLDIDGTNAASLDVDTFGFDVDGSSGEITLTSDIHVNYYVLNVNGEMGEDTFDLALDSTDPTLTGELLIIAPAGTAIVEVDNNDNDTDVTKIVSGGPISLTGSGYFTSDITAKIGECIVSIDDLDSFSDGITVTNCL